MKTSLNFLPQTIQRQQVIRNCLIRWSFLAGVCFVAMGVFAWHESRLATSKQSEIAKLQQRHEDLVLIQTNVAQLEQELLTTEKPELPEFNSPKQFPVLSLMAGISEASGDCQKKLTVREFSFEQLQEVIAGTNNFVVTLNGFATEPASVSLFHRKLQDLNLFREVKIISTAKGEESRFPVTVYQIQCRF